MDFPKYISQPSRLALKGMEGMEAPNVQPASYEAVWCLYCGLPMPTAPTAQELQFEMDVGPGDLDARPAEAQPCADRPSPGKPSPGKPGTG